MRCEHYGTLPIYRNRILSISVSKQFVLPSKTSFLRYVVVSPITTANTILYLSSQRRLIAVAIGGMRFVGA